MKGKKIKCGVERGPEGKRGKGKEREERRRVGVKMRRKEEKKRGEWKGEHGRG